MRILSTAVDTAKRLAETMYAKVEHAYVYSDTHLRYALSREELRQVFASEKLKYLGEGVCSLAMGSKYYAYKTTITYLLDGRGRVLDSLDERRRMFNRIVEYSRHYMETEWQRLQDAKELAGTTALKKHVLCAKVILDPWPIMIAERLKRISYFKMTYEQRSRMQDIFNQLRVGDPHDGNIGFRANGDMVILDYGADYLEFDENGDVI